MIGYLPIKVQVQANRISDSDKEKWVTFVTDHIDSTIYQTPAMFELFKLVKNYNPFVFFAKNINSEIEGLLLAVLIKESSGIIGYLSSRVLVFGGPLIKKDLGDKLEVLNILVYELVQTLKNKSIFIQFRNFFEWNEEEKQIFTKHGFAYRDRQNIILELSSKEDVLRNMSESKRRQVRLAKKKGTITRSPQSIEEVKTFYHIIKQLYKNEIRKPLPDFSFFKEFYNRSIKGLGIIRLVLVNDKIIGGVVAPITPGKSIYYWYVAGLDRQYKDNYPSVLAVWSLMEYGLVNNIRELDFMGIGKPNQEYGVREFKMRFSKNIIDYGRFGRRNNDFLYNIAEFGYNILRSIKNV